jgi:hypothetical protein
VDLAGRSSPLEALQEIADRTGLAIGIDPDAKPRLERAPSAVRSVRGAVAGEALRRVLEPLGLDHFLGANGVVQVTLRRWTGEDLAARIRAEVLPGSWEEAEGRSVRFQNGLLIIRNTLEAHGEVRRFLAGLRR